MSGIDHVILNCNNYEAAKSFYEWLMPRLGFTPVADPDGIKLEVVTRSES